MVTRRYSEIEIRDKKFIKKIKNHQENDAFSSYQIEKNSSFLLEKLIPSNTPKILAWSDEERTLTFEYFDTMVDLREILLFDSSNDSLQLFDQVFELLVSFEKMSFYHYDEYRSFDGFELRNLGMYQQRIVFFDPHNYTVAAKEKDIARFVLSYLMLHWPSPKISLDGITKLRRALSRVDCDRTLLGKYVEEIFSSRKQHALAGRNLVIRLYVSALFFVYYKILKIIRDEF